MHKPTPAAVQSINTHLIFGRFDFPTPWPALFHNSNPTYCQFTAWPLQFPIMKTARWLLSGAWMASHVTAFFKIPCSRPVVVERADPIVNPGTLSGHVHTVMGGNGFDFSMTYEQARASSCSTCKVTADLSNYWTPSLYYRGQNGKFTSVGQAGGMLVYYL